MNEKPYVTYKNPHVFNEFAREYTRKNIDKSLDENNTLDEITIDNPLFGIIESSLSTVNDPFLDDYKLGLKTSLYTNFNADHFLKNTRIEEDLSSVIIPEIDAIEWQVQDSKSYIPNEIHLLTPIYEDFSRRSVFEGRAYVNRIQAHQDEVNKMIDTICNYMGCNGLNDRTAEFDFASMDLDRYI
ncbi:MAG: hypothetical protein R6V53_05560 [Candidatus Woesearchaeota archaeon]